jgi:probable phosphoglycerate mutase
MFLNYLRNVDNCLGFPLNRIKLLLQTPGSPVAGGKSGGREASKRIVLVCNGTTQGNTEVTQNRKNVFYQI